MANKIPIVIGSTEPQDLEQLQSGSDNLITPFGFQFGTTSGVLTITGGSGITFRGGNANFGFSVDTSGILNSGLITSGKIGNAAVVSGSIGSGQIGPRHLDGANLASGLFLRSTNGVNFGWANNYQLISQGSGGIATQAPTLAFLTTPQFTWSIGAGATEVNFDLQLTDQSRTTEEPISGVRAVSISKSGTLRIAMAGVSGRMPAVGVVTENFASGVNANVYSLGLHQVTSGLVDFSGYLGENLFVGRSGHVVTASGSWNSGGVQSGCVLQRIGTIYNSGAFGLKIAPALGGWLTPQLTDRVPVHGWRVYNSNTSGIPNNTNVRVYFDTERYDTDGYHNTSSGTMITIPTGLGGVYSMGFASEWTSNASGARQQSFILNNVTNLAVDTIGKPGGAVALRVVTHTEHRLDDGDYVDVNVLQTAGATINLNAAGNYSPEFWGHRIGE